MLFIASRAFLSAVLWREQVTFDEIMISMKWTNTLSLSTANSLKQQFTGTAYPSGAPELYHTTLVLFVHVAAGGKGSLPH